MNVYVLLEEFWNGDFRDPPTINVSKVFNDKAKADKFKEDNTRPGVKYFIYLREVL